MEKDLARLQQLVKDTWAKLPPDEKAKLELKMQAAHAHLLAARSKTLPAGTRPPHRELVALHRVLHEDLATLAARPPRGVLTTVLPDGEILDGGVDYDSTDPWWAYCFVAYYWTEGMTPPFQVGKATSIPDNVTLAILGDWGGANPPALAIAKAQQTTSYIIHLGDVYYAGTNEGEHTYPMEVTNFLSAWPGVVGRSFALNSNHDMYAHATGYSLTTLRNKIFQTQGGNCFALYNKAFRIVCLDSAYYAPDPAFDGYMKGYLGDAGGGQMKFLLGQISQLTSGQRLILLTHHNALTIDGSIPGQSDDEYLLWQQVTQALQQLPAGANQNVLWYWGHVHVGAVYKSQTVGKVTISPRCCGHGCIPWGIPTDLQPANGPPPPYAPNVLWFEQTLIPQEGSNYFVTNGYATLTLNGSSLTEAFWNQNGNQSWSGSLPAA